MTETERCGLLFAKTGSIKSGTGAEQRKTLVFNSRRYGFFPLVKVLYGGWADARQCARRQPRSRPGAERAAQGRSARPLVKVPREVFKKVPRLDL